MKFLLLFILTAFLACKPKKDVDIYQCPVTVALQLHYIDSHMPLSEESRQKLKLFFECNDSLAEVAYKKGDNLEKIASWYYPSMDTLLTFLNPLECNDMIVSIRERYHLKNSKKTWTLREIICSRKDLGFDKTVVNRLLKACSNLEDSTANEKLSPKTEKDSLMTILTEQQLKKYFKIRGKVQARKTTLAQMAKLKENGLYTDEKDGGKLYLKLFHHEFETKGILEYMDFLGDNKGYDRERFSMFTKKPLELIHLESLNDFSHDLLTDVLCKRNVVKLDKQQEKKLLETYRKVLEADYEAKYVSEITFNREVEQMHYLEKILSKKQINSYFVHICKDNAVKKAQEEWYEIKKCKIFLKKDSTVILPQLINYEVKLAVANKWTSLNRSRRNLFIKEEIINSSPQILIDLNTYKRQMKEKEIVRF